MSMEIVIVIAMAIVMVNTCCVVRVIVSLVVP
eukprot:COSAG05_NODE_1325_length_5180_cov_5.433576_1_plen_32_part_00